LARWVAGASPDLGCGTGSAALGSSESTTDSATTGFSATGFSVTESSVTASAAAGLFAAVSVLPFFFLRPKPSREGSSRFGS
jgi:hypothetical protein